MRIYGLLLVLTAAACADPEAEESASAVHQPGAADGTLVRTDRGLVRGVHEGDTLVFRGIPFSAPRAGAQRWLRPEKPARWDGELDASTFRPVCLQWRPIAGVVAGDEDCLYVNVYVPDWARRGDDLAVMVWIHGGGNINGSGETEAHRLAARGVVVVTIAYRLGNVGFPGHRALSDEALLLYGLRASGNYGYQDQLAALRWVKKNIERFGGDHRRVTIFGESAGGADVMRLLGSRLSHGLTDGAISQSGLCPVTVSSTIAQAEEAGAQLAAAIGCSNPDAAAELACMRAAPPEAIVGNGVFIPENGTTVLDGYVFDEPPFAPLQARGAGVPLVVGSNREDVLMSLIQRRFDISEAEYVELMHEDFGASADELIATYYPASAYPTPFDAYVAARSDQFICCDLFIAESVSAPRRAEPVYQYRYKHRIENDAELASFGAYHTQEINFIFGEFDDHALAGYVPTAAELELSNQIMGYWTRFAASGDPNGDGAAPWPRFAAADDAYLEIDTVPAAVTHDWGPVCALLLGP